jgi:hypothetical protein
MITSEEQMLQKRLNKEVLSQRYRQRVSKFVAVMAQEPMQNPDEYNKTWNHKNAPHLTVRMGETGGLNFGRNGPGINSTGRNVIFKTLYS